MKYNQSTLNKIERILEESEYVVRNERGTFQSGYCILEERKVIVLNKFLQIEGRINTLIDLVPQLNIQAEQLTPETRKMYDEIIRLYNADKEQTDDLSSPDILKHIRNCNRYKISFSHK